MADSEHIQTGLTKRYYNAYTLRLELDEFERRYGMTSEEHLRLRYGGTGGTPGVPGFDSHVWADTYREWKRLKRA